MSPAPRHGGDATGIVRFGPYLLDLDRGELRRDGERVDLRPKPTQVLVELVRHAGRLVSHEELTRAAWGEGHSIIDSSLHTTISQLREALGDDAAQPRYVQTVHRRGYRFVCPVEPAGPHRLPAAAVSRLTRAGLPLVVPAVAAAAVAAVLLAVVLLAPGDEAASAAEPTDAVLRGRYLLIRGGKGDIDEAMRVLRQAVENNSATSPMAWAGLARAELRRWRLDDATAAAERALALDSDQPDALAVLGEIDIYAHRDWERAERRFVRSLSLQPDAPAAHGGYATLLVFLGRHEEAVREARLARKQAPLSLITNTDLAWILGLAGRHREAVEQARVTLELDPDAPGPYGILHAALRQLGDLEGARNALAMTLEHNGAASDLLARIRAAPPEAGLQLGYAWLADAMESNADSGLSGHLWAAVGHMLMDRPERALDALDVAARRNEPLLPIIACDPRFATLHQEPAFRRILDDLGLGA